MIAGFFWFFVGFIVYVYMGYPLLLAALARLKSKQQLHQTIAPPVTLLIAAYNEEAIIETKLKNSLALDYPCHRLQIIVTADGSDDQTAAIVRRYADQGVVLNYTPERDGKMVAIMRAMPLATGDIVVFSDANNMYEPPTIRELVQPFADPTVGATTGAKHILRGDGALGDSEGLYWKYESFIKKMETRLGCCTAVAGEILAVRRQLFKPVPREILVDDLYIALQIIRNGHRLAYVPTARSRERVSPTAQDEMTRRSRIIVGRYQVMGQATKLLPWKRPLITWQIISHKFLRPLIPFAMIGALAANLVALMLPATHQSAYFAALAPWLLGMQAVFYGLAVIGNHTEIRGIVGKLLYLPTFLVNSNLAALVGWYRYWTQRQTGIWQRVGRRESILH